MSDYSITGNIHARNVAVGDRAHAGDSVPSAKRPGPAEVAELAAAVHELRDRMPGAGNPSVAAELDVLEAAARAARPDAREIRAALDPLRLRLTQVCSATLSAGRVLLAAEHF